MNEAKVYEIREGQGSAFANKTKTEDWHPKFTGKCRINDVLYFFSVNPKRTANGDEYMDFRLGKAVNAAPAANINSSPRPKPEFDDDVPF